MRLISVLLILFIGNAAAQDARLAPGDFRTVTARLDDAIDRNALLAQCPADHAGTPTVEYEELKDVCRLQSAACVELCVNLDRPNHCFAMALLLQKAKEKSKDWHEALFAKACSLGMPLGCTNWAAGMLTEAGETGRNAIGDADTTYACTFRTFDMTCGADDAWGCMMLGISLATGRGTSVDRDLARAKLDRTCVLLPGEGPCENAMAVRNWIETQAE